MIDRYCTKSMDLGMFLSILLLLLSHHMLTNWEVHNTSTRLLSNSTLFCTRFDLQSFILLLSSSILNPWQGCCQRNSGPIGHTICFWITRMPCCSSWCFTKKWFTNTILTQKEMGAYEGTTIPLPNETAILDCWRIESAKPFKSQTTRPSVSSHCVWIQAATELTIKILLIVLLDPTLVYWQIQIDSSLGRSVPICFQGGGADAGKVRCKRYQIEFAKCHHKLQYLNFVVYTIIVLIS